MHPCCYSGILLNSHAVNKMGLKHKTDFRGVVNKSTAEAGWLFDQGGSFNRAGWWMGAVCSWTGKIRV